MFCVVYEFEVNQENESEFQAVWHQLTIIIRENCGGLGSRLHKDLVKENVWVAYAQWPDENTWNQPKLASEIHAQLRDKLKQICVDIRAIYQLNVIDDLLHF